MFKRTVYYTNGRIRSIIEYNALGKEVYSNYYKEDGTPGIEDYEYHANGTLAYYVIGDIDGNISERASYTENGAPLSVSKYYENGIPQRLESYKYYENGALKYKRIAEYAEDGNGSVTTVSYNEQGKVESEIVSDAKIW